MKSCTRCGKAYEESSEFFTRRGEGITSTCRVCHREMQKSYKERNKERVREANKIYYNSNKEHLLSLGKKWYEKNKDRCIALDKEWKKSNPDRCRVTYIKHRYKVDPVVIMNMMDDQRGCCKICKDSLVYPDSDRSYSIDHDHSTGDIRGLLCMKCNISLGNMMDNIDSIRKMINYLEDK